MQVDFAVNRGSRQVEARRGKTLLAVLRERCGILSPNDGCQPQGRCGCCVGHVRTHG